MSGNAFTESLVSRRPQWLNMKLLVAGVVILLAVGYLMYSGMQSTAAAYFVTVGELQAKSEAVDGQRVRVGGDVREGSIVKGAPGDPIRFEVTDGTATIPVVYEGIVPDIFSDHAQVVVEGTYHADGPFEAKNVLTKCPSRFEAAPASQ